MTVFKTKWLVTLLLLAASMVVLSLASVPIYSLFCKVTGYGGTVQYQSQNLNKIGNRLIKVKFDSNVSKDLMWEFYPKQNSIDVLTGENALVYYFSKNYSKNDIIGISIYNVTPHKAGKYFNKIHCFCFEEQLLKAGANMLMPVSFFIDPEIEKDPYMNDVNTITLSYSFYKVRDVSSNIESN